MNKLDVRIIRLEPMRVASIHGFGANPEEKAWQKLEEWAQPRKLFDDPAAHPIYGFNNPNPSAGSPNYGYELWLQVDADAQPDDGMQMVDFEGGLYAVTRCEVPVGNMEAIGATWKRLVAWYEQSKYSRGDHQWLEKSVLIPQWGNLASRPDLEFAMDLFLPIRE